jgi:chromosome segregation ATPase
MKRPPKHKADEFGSGSAFWAFQDNAEAMSAFLLGEKSADLVAFMALVKEVGRSFKKFSPPDGFVPEKAQAPAPLTPELARDLGAATLDDFYHLALGEEKKEIFAPQGLPKYFPKGPESIRPALTATDLEIKRLTKSIEDLERGWPTSQPGFEAAIKPRESRLAALTESRRNLREAARLWPRMKEDSSLWPLEAKDLWRKAQGLSESVLLVLKSAREAPGDPESRAASGRSRRSLTRAMMDLKSELDAARHLLDDSARWSENLENLLSDLDNFLAVVLDGSQPDRDWNALSRRLSARLTDLERDERLQAEETGRAVSAVKRTLAAVVETENRLAGRIGSETLDRLESAGRSVQTLWRKAVEQRRELARLYVAAPPRLGRPLHLEKVFLGAALFLGRAQTLLEDLRHRLTLAGGRLTNTQRLRAEGEELVERLERPAPRAAQLKSARRRLNSLARAVDQRLALTETKERLDEMRLYSRDTRRELVRGRSENKRLGQQLSAAAQEKERLADQLSAARQLLGDIGLVKARLLKLFQRKTELLKEVEQARQGLENDNQALKDERDELKAERARLAGIYAEERAEQKRIAAELSRVQGELEDSRRLLDERKEAVRRLEETRKEKEELDARRRALELRLEKQAREQTETAARAEALSTELLRLGQELDEASRSRLALGENAATLRRKLDLLNQAHSSLSKTLQRRERSLAESESDRERLTGRLTRQKNNLLRLVSVRQRLRAELGASRLKMVDLEAERDAIAARLEEARLTASALSREKSETTLALTEEKERLAEKLRALESQMADGLTPLIRIMGEALWRSEAQLKRARGASARLQEQFQMESDVREANLRLEAAGRELDILEKARLEQERLQKDLAHSAGQIVELQAVRELLTHERNDLTDLGRNLSGQVERLDGRYRRLRLAVGLIKGRQDQRLEEERLTGDALRGLLERRGRELEERKAQLARLEPLVAYFLDLASGAGGEMAGQPGFDLELIDYLKEESRNLFGPDGPVRGENPELSRLKARLAELEPLTAFLARSFFTEVAELAQTRQERRQLADELSEAREEQRRLSAELSRADSTRQVLEDSLASRATELQEVRGQAFVLARERDSLQDSLVEKSGEIITLKSELAQADQDLTENDGRLEAAWAAMNYLGSRAGDSLAGLKNKLDSQARQVDRLSAELKSRDERVKELEERQNQLALLYWTLIAKAAGAEAPLIGASPSGEPALAPAMADGSPEVPPLAAAPDEHDQPLVVPPAQSEDQARNSGGHSLSRGLLEGVKKVARRSLFTLLLSGGLVLAGSLPAPAAGPPAPLPSSPPESRPVHLLSRLDSTYIGRSVGLEQVESGPRLAGRPALEKRLAEMVGDLARGQGLSNGEFLRLVRAARGPESTVHLNDFAGRAGSLTLLEAQFPALSRQLKAWPPEILTQSRLNGLMKGAADFKNAEAAYWERLFFDYLADHEPGPALDLLLEHLGQKAELALRPRPEFAGRLAPFPEIENLGPDRFISFMAGYIKSDWPSFGGRVRARAALRLAGDLYFSARLFAQPATLLAAFTHYEAESRELDFFRRGATSALHKLAADLADLTRNSALSWLPGRPPLCDLDQALADFESPAVAEALYRRKMALVQAYNKSLNAGLSLFDEIDDHLAS